MKSYLNYFKLRVITNLQYRVASIAGISTQFFFGLVYIMVYLALYESNTDVSVSFDLKSLMKEDASHGNTVFFSTHILEIAEKLCDRIAIINKGKIVFVGTLNELKEKYGDKKTLEEIFLNIIE